MLPALKPALIFECVGIPGLLQQVFEGAPRDARIVVVGVCMETDRSEPFLGIVKELNVQYVLGYTPEEFASALRLIAEGQVDAASLVTATVGIDGVAARVHRSRQSGAPHQDHRRAMAVDPATSSRPSEARAAIHTAKNRVAAKADAILKSRCRWLWVPGFRRDDVGTMCSHTGSAIEYFTWLSAKLELDRGDAVEPRQLVLQERFIRRQIGGDDAQQIVAVAGHQIAFQHLVPFRDRPGEAIEVFFLLPRQLDRDEDADMQAERFLVDGGDIAA